MKSTSLIIAFIFSVILAFYTGKFSGWNGLAIDEAIKTGKMFSNEVTAQELRLWTVEITDKYSSRFNADLAEITIPRSDWNEVMRKKFPSKTTCIYYDSRCASYIEFDFGLTAVAIPLLGEVPHDNRKFSSHMIDPDYPAHSFSWYR